jgi:hypothetical protein
MDNEAVPFKEFVSLVAWQPETERVLKEFNYALTLCDSRGMTICQAMLAQPVSSGN